MRYTTIEETPRKRPIGVTIIALLLGIQAVLGISIGVVTMIGGLGGTLSFLGIIATMLGLIELFFAWGLWTLQRWAFWATVIIELFSLVDSALFLLQPRANVGGIQMAVTTNTQTVQIHTMATPGTETATLDKQSLGYELKEASQQFFSTLFRVGVRLTLTLRPVSLLPEEPREHFVSAAREFTRGLTTLAYKLADNVDKIVEEVETDLKKDI